MKSDKMPYIIYADLESLIKKIDGCANNPEKPSTTKIGKHILCEYSKLLVWWFDHIKDKHTLYHGKDCTKKFCKSLREHAEKKKNWFWKEKHVTVNKQRVKMTRRYKSVLYLQQIFHKQTL